MPSSINPASGNTRSLSSVLGENAIEHIVYTPAHSATGNGCDVTIAYMYATNMIYGTSSIKAATRNHKPLSFFLVPPHYSKLGGHPAPFSSLPTLARLMYPYIARRLTHTENSLDRLCHNRRVWPRSGACYHARPASGHSTLRRLAAST